MYDTIQRGGGYEGTCACTKECGVESRKYCPHRKYTESLPGSEVNEHRQGEVSFLKNEEICAAEGKEAVLGSVLAAQRHIVACGINAITEGRAIAAPEKI